MTYGGESWNKKLAREWTLSTATNRMNLTNMRCMVLGGPDAADARWLRTMGAQEKNIVIVDRDEACISAARRVVPGALHWHGDLLEAAPCLRGCIDVLVLDFCSQLNEASVDLFAKVAMTVGKEDTRLVAAFSYGRELGQRASLVQDTKREGFRITRESAGVGYARRYRSSDPKAARVTTFLRYADTSFGKRGGLFGPLPRHLGPFSVFYGAQKESGAVTPMVYFTGWMAPVRYPAFGKRGVITDPDLFDDAHMPLVDNPNAIDDIIGVCAGGRTAVREAVISAIRDCAASEVADEYNLSIGQVAAWWAVAARQGHVRGEGAP